MQAEAERARKRIDEQLAFVERFRAKATKARQAQSRLRQIERIELPEVVHTSRRVPLFRFRPQPPQVGGYAQRRQGPGRPLQAGGYLLSKPPL